MLLRRALLTFGEGPELCDLGLCGFQRLLLSSRRLLELRQKGSEFVHRLLLGLMVEVFLSCVLNLICVRVVCQAFLL